MSNAFDVEYGRLRRMTLPGLLCENAQRQPDAVAYRAKLRGVYHERSWVDYAGRVARCAAAFEKLGLAGGERVAIMGNPCEEWMIADQAAQALGGISYGIYPTASSEEIAYQMRDGGAVLFVAENQEYVDKILAIADTLDNLRHIVVIDATAMFAYDDPRLKTYDDLVAEETAGPGWLADRAARLDPDAPAFIVYTSGTTGAPKGAVISHGRHLAATYNIVTIYPMLAEREQRAVVFLPLCHVLGRDIAMTLPMLSRLVPHFGEDVEDIATTMFEVAPTVLFTVPRYLQKFASQILIGIAKTTGLKRSAYEFAMKLARRTAEARWNGPLTIGQAAGFSAAWGAVFRPILNKFGLDKLELVISGGAPLPTDIGALWQIYGLNVVEMYGQTETAGGIIAGQTGPYARPGSVGIIPPGWNIRFSETGEIEVHSPDLFDRYWNNDAATAEAFTEDGWLRTGDIGEMVDGQLKLIDRARDFIVTAGGKTISPSYVENAFRSSPYFSEVVVFGQGRKYLTALVEIDFDMVSDWARRNDVSYSGFTSLTRNPAVFDLLAGEIAKGNERLARVEQIKDFRILYKELDPEEEGEPVTPTRKIKRGLMLKKYAELVEEMYDDREDRLVAAAIGAD
ncbi:MAG: long-chain fatty acid--CoA ligase [Rhodobacteraceae bacterium]|nr:long-chain fatty acid--CoA ligase [Paracoccaceae bacterium]